MNKEDYRIVKDPVYRYDGFSDGKVLHGKKKGRLPAMGWNSWNAFGSGNTEALTKEMAEAMLRLGLDQVGYQYLVLDDGCYKPERVEGRLSNDTVKFPGGFRALADELHEKGLKFGMYNDIGTNLCAGAAVGTCGHEETDAETYLDWDVDFLKVDNCYYLWDNATFSDPSNARYVFAPNLREVTIQGKDFSRTFDLGREGSLTGSRAERKEGYVTGLGTFDGTGPEHSPVGNQSSELVLEADIPEDGEYHLLLTYATGETEGTGAWLQIAVEHAGESRMYLDDLLPATKNPFDFCMSDPIAVKLGKGKNVLRFMNHRRQENTLGSYGTLVKALHDRNPEKEILLSICEWGKTQPQNWGYKTGDSWRILNDITFQVGADGDPGVGAWSSDYTTSVTAQYNKAVIMDEFAGLDKGWNDPDMMMIGMDGLSETMCKTHMTMWCMMNAPLMLGLDLRRVEKGDWIWKIIADQRLIALNQDELGVQAKRIFCSVEKACPDTAYVREPDRVDILAKPLADGSVALSFLNISEKTMEGRFSVSAEEIIRYLGGKLPDAERFQRAQTFQVTDLCKGESWVQTDTCFGAERLSGCDSVTLLVVPE